MSDIEFIPNKNNLANLDELSLMGSVLAERRICELYEIADVSARIVYEMLNGGFGIYEALSLIGAELTDGEHKIHKEHLPENFEMLLFYAKAFSVFDKASFARLLLAGISERGAVVSERDFFEKEQREESIAYVKSQLANEAYDVFADSFKEPRLKYVSDIKEAVSLVTRAEAGYAILPLEEKGGARLSSITEILYRSELKINSVTPVFGALGNADMKYALVSPSVSLPAMEEGDDRYLELRIPATDTFKFSELVSVAESLGIELYRVNTISFDGEDGSFPYFSLVLKREASDFTEMLTYLTLFVSDYTSVGIYKNLE